MFYLPLYLLCVSCPSANEFSAIFFLLLPDQAQILLDHFNVLDELWGEIQMDPTTDEEFPHRPQF